MDECHPDSWAANVQSKTLDIPNHFHYYLSCVYWSVVTLTTVGYGDLVPVTDIEIVFSIIVMVLGRLMLILILGMCASSLIDTYMELIPFKEKYSVLKVIGE